jgi:uncharacterized membrane protein
MKPGSDGLHFIQGAGSKEQDQRMKHIAVAEATLEPVAGRKSDDFASVKPIHQILAPFPVAYFAAAFVTDLAYWRTAEVMWERFSVWLIAGGLVISALVALAAVIDLVFARQQPAWFRALSYAVAVLLSLLNVFVHSRDGYTAVLPTGMTLSAIVVAILLVYSITAGWTLTDRRHGVRS